MPWGVEHAVDLVDFLGAEAEPSLEPPQQLGREARGDRQPDSAAAAPRDHRLLHDGQQIAGVVVLDRHVGVAGDAEEGPGEDLAAGEQQFSVLGDDVLQPRQVDLRLAGQVDEPRQAAGDGDHRDAFLAAALRLDEELKHHVKL